jgi:hypothetical protein
MLEDIEVTRSSDNDRRSSVGFLRLKDAGQAEWRTGAIREDHDLPNQIGRFSRPNDAGLRKRARELAAERRRFTFS